MIKPNLKVKGEINLFKIYLKNLQKQVMPLIAV